MVSSKKRHRSHERTAEIGAQSLGLRIGVYQPALSYPRAIVPPNATTGCRTARRGGGARLPPIAPPRRPDRSVLHRASAPGGFDARRVGRGLLRSVTRWQRGGPPSRRALG